MRVNATHRRAIGHLDNSCDSHDCDSLFGRTIIATDWVHGVDSQRADPEDAILK
jgi:hypothetical protein